MNEQCENCKKDIPYDERWHLTEDGVVLCDECWDALATLMIVADDVLSKVPKP